MYKVIPVSRGRPKKKLTLDDFPKEFRKAIIKFMADSLRLAGVVLEGKNREINKRVDAEAEYRHRSRHFTELNKALKTRGKTDYNNGWWDAKKRYCITYPCTVCGKPIEVQANGPELQTIRQAVKTWGHNECIK